MDAFWFQTFVFFGYYYCLRGHPFMTFTKNGQQMTLPLPPSAKMNNRYNQIMESANTWQILRTPFPRPFFCRHHKCKFPFWFFKGWSVACLTANEILNFMKIQSSYQRNQALISNYISYFLNNILVSLCQ